MEACIISMEQQTKAMFGQCGPTCNSNDYDINIQYDEDWTGPPEDPPVGPGFNTILDCSFNSNPQSSSRRQSQFTSTCRVYILWNDSQWSVILYWFNAKVWMASSTRK